MTTLLTYCNDDYTISAHNLCASAVKHGVDHAHITTNHDIPELFDKMMGDNFKEIARHQFYIWKPFVIWDYMRELEDGSVLLYVDAGTTITDSVIPLIQGMEQDIQMFHNPWRHVEWCKMDVMKEVAHAQYQPNYMMKEYDYGLDENFKNISDAKQTQASFIIFRITPEVRSFVKEWMLYCLMPGFCDNSPSKLPNYPSFQEHRYDQAVLCCLQIKYGYRMREFPSVLNGDAEYKILDHHRKNNDQWL